MASSNPLVAYPGSFPLPFSHRYKNNEMIYRTPLVTGQTPCLIVPGNGHDTSSVGIQSQGLKIVFLATTVGLAKSDSKQVPPPRIRRAVPVLYGTNGSTSPRQRSETASGARDIRTSFMFKGNRVINHFRSTPCSLSLLEAANDVSFLSVRLPKYVRKGMSVRIEVVASSAAAAAIPFARDSPCHHMLCSHCSSLFVER